MRRRADDLGECFCQNTAGTEPEAAEGDLVGVEEEVAEEAAGRVGQVEEVGKNCDFAVHCGGEERSCVGEGEAKEGGWEDFEEALDELLQFFLVSLLPLGPPLPAQLVPPLERIVWLLRPHCCSCWASNLSSSMLAYHCFTATLSRKSK